MVDLVFRSLLNHNFIVARPDRASDGQGGFNIVYSFIDALDGRLRPASGRERMLAQQEERVITHVFYTETDNDLRRGDVLSPGSLMIAGNQVLADDILVKIEGRREPSTTDHHFEFDCIEYQHETGAEVGS